MTDARKPARPRVDALDLDPSRPKSKKAAANGGVGRIEDMDDLRAEKSRERALDVREEFARAIDRERHPEDYE